MDLCRPLGTWQLFWGQMLQSFQLPAHQAFDQGFGVWQIGKAQAALGPGGMSCCCNSCGFIGDKSGAWRCSQLIRNQIFAASSKPSMALEKKRSSCSAMNACAKSAGPASPVHSVG